MKTLRLAVIAALCASSLSPVAIAPAFADIAPRSETTSAMAGVCTDELALKGAPLLHDDSPSLTVAVFETGQSDAAPVELNRSETPGTRFGTGVFTYSDFSIAGEPFRNGGSVNMFGDKVATKKNWSNSEYDFTADYSTTTTINYNCEYTRITETYVPPVPGVEARPVEGYYYRDPEANGNIEAVEQACARFTEKGATQPFWGDPQAQCLFFKTADAVEAVDPIDGYWTDPVSDAAPDLTSGHVITEENIAYGVAGHEANAGPWTELAKPGDRWLAEKVVVCISPKKLPGIWTNQNGYTGTNCKTAYFNTAPWGGGSQTSNGTYISVPGI